ncbi:Establishment of cohesion 1 [Bulinus truncatus]|nr:Establishment of cohesion 1 [Bulinus truncatus]
MQSSSLKRPFKKKNSSFELTLESLTSVSSKEKNVQNKTKWKIYKSKTTVTPRCISVIPGKGFDLKFQSNVIKKKHKGKIKNSKTRHQLSKKVKTVLRKPLQTFPVNSQTISQIVVKENPACICTSGFVLSDEISKKEQNINVSTDLLSIADENINTKDSQNSQSVPENIESPENIQNKPKEKQIDCVFETEHESPESSATKEISNLSKLFPIFSKNFKSTSTKALNRSESKSPPPKKRKTKDEGPQQMILDAGQKQFGAIQCSVCNMVYCASDPVDKAAHRKFHVRLEEALKFSGWKKERIVQEFAEDSGRVLLILPEDPKYMRKKLDEVNHVMSQDLGFLETNPFSTHSSKIFLYVQDKQMSGCCVAEPVDQGYRIIPVDHKETKGQRPWRCNEVPEPASVGISRLWVAAEKRKSGIATKLVDCARQWFNYGTLIPKFKVAFSDPTPDGYKFASKYIGSNSFLVYKYREL